MRLYQRLLWLYPRPFREEYGREMCQLFDDLYHDARHQGQGWHMLGFWLGMLRDLGKSVWAEHLFIWRNNMSRKQAVPYFLGVLLLIYSFSFAGFNILKYNLGVKIAWEPFAFITDNAQPTLFHVILNLLIVLGPVLAIALFALPMVSLRFDWQSDQFATIVISKGNRLTYVLIALCLLVGGIFVLYVIGENLPCLIGSQLRC